MVGLGSFNKEGTGSCMRGEIISVKGGEKIELHCID